MATHLIKGQNAFLFNVVKSHTGLFSVKLEVKNATELKAHIFLYLHLV